MLIAEELRDARRRDRPDLRAGRASRICSTRCSGASASANSCVSRETSWLRVECRAGRPVWARRCSTYWSSVAATPGAKRLRRGAPRRARRPADLPADDLGQMSCNPSIGGVGKGHLVREVDAIGGIMARAADRAAIHRRMLNAQQGQRGARPAGPGRPALYRQAVGELAGRAVASRSSRARRSRCDCDGGAVAGRRDWPTGSDRLPRRVVIATGTFLGATHVPRRGAVERRPARRAQAAMRAGRPDSRDWAWPGPAQDRNAAAARRPDDRLGAARAAAERPRGVDDVALDAESAPQPQLACAITRTNERSHDVIRAGLRPFAAVRRRDRGAGAALLPVDRGQGPSLRRPRRAPDLPRARGPRRRTWSIPTAFRPRCRPTSSCDLVRSIEGLERAEIVQPGYAVEYEYADPRRLEPDARASRGRRAVFRRPDQRHDRL